MRRRIVQYTRYMALREGILVRVTVLYHSHAVTSG